MYFSYVVRSRETAHVHTQPDVERILLRRVIWLLFLVVAA